MSKIVKSPEMIPLAKGVKLTGMKLTLTQNSDSCGPVDEDQFLEVGTEDAGDGNYLIIKTDRWAIDSDDIDKFAATLKQVISQCQSYFQEDK